MASFSPKQLDVFISIARLGSVKLPPILCI